MKGASCWSFESNIYISNQFLFSFMDESNSEIHFWNQRGDLILLVEITFK